MVPGSASYERIRGRPRLGTELPAYSTVYAVDPRTQRPILEREPTARGFPCIERPYPQPARHINGVSARFGTA
jgi:hypothetical protein